VAADMSMFRRNDARIRREMDRVQSEITRLSQTVARYDADRRPDPAAAAAAAIEPADPAPAPAATVDLPPLPELDDLRTRVDAVVAQLTALDARITSVSTELANQLRELGGDIDALGARPPAAVDEGSLEEVRDTQVRLANEQARYQIAFRADLARLAEHLQRTRP